MVSFGGRGRKGFRSREDQADGSDAMDDRYENRVERDGRPESLPSTNVSQGEFSPMLKPLTFSLSLAVALGLCSVSMAGGYDANCTTCGLGVAPGRSVSPLARVVVRGAANRLCAPRSTASASTCRRSTCRRFSCPKIVHTCSYEWVLKKKHCFSIQHQPKAMTVAAARSMRLARVAFLRRARVVLLLRGQYAAPQVYGAGQHAFQPARPATSIAVCPG